MWIEVTDIRIIMLIKGTIFLGEWIGFINVVEELNKLERALKQHLHQIQ